MVKLYMGGKLCYQVIAFHLWEKIILKSHMPCHDSSLIAAISSSWKIAVVADGVGSCKHAETASKIAVETVAKLIKEQFPPFVQMIRHISALFVRQCMALQMLLKDT